MQSSSQIGRSYEFGSYRLDTARRLLIRDGKNLTLPPKAFTLLLLLVEGRGRVFTKKELMSALWPDSFVEEGNLSFQITVLRKVLADDGTEWIATLPRYGYRFTGEVFEINTVDPTAVHADVPDHETSFATDEVAVPSPSAGKPTSRSSRRLLFWLPTAVSTGVAIILSVTLLREKPPRERVVRLEISPPAGVMSTDIDSFSVSPDGDRLMFIGVGSDGRRLLWIRALNSLTPEPLTGTELVTSAFWSPDGRSVGFFAAGKLTKLDLLSGVTQTLCETPLARSFGTWGRTGIILFETSHDPEIYSVPVAGGVPTPATALDTSNREIRHSSPQFLPDGRHFIYYVQSDRPENSGIYVASLGVTLRKRLANSDTNGVYAQSSVGLSYLLFTQGTNLLGQGLDLTKLETKGAPFPVAHRLLIGINSSLARPAISASENGVLAYRSRIDTGATELVWFDRQGKQVATVGKPADYSNPALSPDEKMLAVSRVDPQTKTRDLWLFDLATGVSSRFTFDPADETNPVWSSDGSRIAFNAAHKGVTDIYEKAITGTSAPELLLHPSQNRSVQAWSPDGRFLLFEVGPAMWASHTDGKDGKLVGPFAMTTAKISPNGKWVAYSANQSGRSEVYVQNFPPAEGKWQISTGGGMEPSWRGDGKELFYISGDKLIAVEVKGDGPGFLAGVSKPLFDVHLESAGRRSRYQVAANGQRFLANVPIEAATPITVVLNWTTSGAP